MCICSLIPDPSVLNESTGPSYIWWIEQPRGHSLTADHIWGSSSFEGLKWEFTKAYHWTKDLSLSFSPALKPHAFLRSPWSRERERDSRAPQPSFCLCLHIGPLTVCELEVWHFPSGPQISVTQTGKPWHAAHSPTYLREHNGGSPCRGSPLQSGQNLLVPPALQQSPWETGGQRRHVWSVFSSLLSVKWEKRGKNRAQIFTGLFLFGAVHVSVQNTVLKNLLPHLIVFYLYFI